MKIRSINGLGCKDHREEFYFPTVDGVPEAIITAALSKQVVLTHFECVLYILITSLRSGGGACVCRQAH